MDRDQTIELLYELTRMLLARTPLEEKLLTVAGATLALLPGDHASVRILDASRERLLCGARAGAGSESEPMSFRRGEGAIGWVVAEGRTARIADASLDDRFKRLGDHDQGFAIRSLLAVPLRAHGEVVGVLGSTSPDVDRFMPSDETMAGLLANLAAPSIEVARAERLSLTDPLTMAFSERYLLPRIEEELERARRNDAELSLLLLSLDRLDKIIELHGRANADETLKCFTERARSSVRLSDVLVRRKDDSFALIMPEMSSRRVFVTAERIRKSMPEYPLALSSGLKLAPTVSVGVASWNRSESAEELLARAEEARRQAALEGNRTSKSS